MEFLIRVDISEYFSSNRKYPVKSDSKIGCFVWRLKKMFATNCLIRSKTAIVLNMFRLNWMVSEKMSKKKKNLGGHFWELLDELRNRK